MLLSNAKPKRTAHHISARKWKQHSLSQELPRSFQTCVSFAPMGAGGSKAIYFPWRTTTLPIQLQRRKCLSSRAWESIQGSIVLPVLPTGPRKWQGRNRWSSPSLLLVPSAVPQRPPILRWHLHPKQGSLDPPQGSQQLQTLEHSFCLTAPVSPSFSSRTLSGPQASTTTFLPHPLPPNTHLFPYNDKRVVQPQTS